MTEQIHFKKFNKSKRIWTIVNPKRNKFQESLPDYKERFSYHDAIRMIKYIKTTYGITVKKHKSISGRQPKKYKRNYRTIWPYNVRIEFKNETDEILFIMKYNEGMDLDTSKSGTFDWY